MARPSVAHSGFFVPNAQDVAKPSMAEPDRIDFNTVGNSRWGVIEGCLVNVSGTAASNSSGTAIVNGAIVTMPGGQSVNVGNTAQDRYDALCVDSTGTLRLVQGDPSLDPVFPDIPLTMTLLASVLASTGASSYTDTVVDKRNMLSDSLQTRIDPASSLIVNLNGTKNLYKVTGDGVTSWNDDTYLSRSASQTVHVSRRLVVDDDITAGQGIQARSLVTTETVTASNLFRGTALPGSGSPGDVFQNTSSGRLYVWQSGSWQELATLTSAMPVGTVITSFVGEDVMTPLGWVALRGQTVTETQYGGLFSIPALGTPIAGSPRTLVLPDARRRVLLTDYMTAGRTGGSNSVILALANLPTHGHNPRVQQAGGFNLSARTGHAGGHGHSVTGGAHPHSLNDPGHKHPALEGPGFNSSAIGLMWGGQNKIDALFNDRSHTYSVEPFQWGGIALTGISINSAGSEHAHEVSSAPDHDHTISLDSVPSHGHSLLEDLVGQGTAVDTTPAYIAVYSYVRS